MIVAAERHVDSWLLLLVIFFLVAWPALPFLIYFFSCVDVLTKKVYFVLLHIPLVLLTRVAGCEPKKMTDITFAMQKAIGQHHREIIVLFNNISPPIIQQQNWKRKKKMMTMFHILSDSEPSFLFHLTCHKQ